MKKVSIKELLFTIFLTLVNVISIVTLILNIKVNVFSVVSLIILDSNVLWFVGLWWFIVVDEKQDRSIKYKLYHDTLTDCYSRQYLEDIIKKDYKKYEFVAIVDINNLKGINDTYGHEKGDDAIIKVANILKTFGDVVRLGGDEFLLLMNFKNAQDFEKFNECKQEFSYGMCIVDTSLSDSMRLADEFMYKNKKENMNDV